jgi:hypothetical protein
MPDIEKMTSSEWLAYRRDKLDDFYAKGGELKPDHECKTCDVHNDYACFDHELIQTGE